MIKDLYLPLTRIVAVIEQRSQVWSPMATFAPVVISINIGTKAVTRNVVRIHGPNIDDQESHNKRTSIFRR